MNDPDNVPGRPPFLWRHQGAAILSTILVVAAGMLSTYIRTNASSDDGSGFDSESLVLLVVVGLPALALPFLTRRTQVWLPVCLLSIAGWAFLLGSAGDTSCIDCAFVYLIPLSTAGLQILLALLVLVVRSMRRSPYAGETAERQTQRH